MKYSPKDWKRFIVSLQFYGLILLIVLCVAIVSLHILQTELLKNAQQTGNTMAHGYALSVGHVTSSYESALRVGVRHLERLTQSGSDSAQIQDWLNAYLGDIRIMTGDEGLSPLAVAEGLLMGINMPASSALPDWYETALATPGQIVYTDMHTDPSSLRQVITVAMSDSGGACAMAFDIFPENLHAADDMTILPQGSSYFLCSQSGTLIYAHTDAEASFADIQAYLDRVITSLQNGELSQPDSYIYDMDGRQRGVYASSTINGWMSIVTVPYRTILYDLRLFTMGGAAVFLLFILFTVLISARNYRLSRRVERTNETVRVLGNSYYAIYRVNHIQGTYEMIKGSDYFRQKLPLKGAYPSFLAVASEVIEETACSEFVESFSLENIRSLVENGIRDFGGDFRRRFGQEYRWVNVRILFDESLNHDEVVICFREIGAEKQAQLQQVRLLESALDKARKSEASQGRFFSSMSHDMRTPLNAIIGLSELAAQHVDDAGQTRKYLGKINVASRQLLGLINDILEFSRLEQGRLELNRQTFDLKDCLNECIGVFRTQAQSEEKELTLSFDVQDSAVLGDSPRITQVLNNLLSNAVKFTEPGGKIVVKVRQMDSQKYAKYQFIVSDDGRGMSPEFLQKIFEPYEREVRFGSRRVSGTGLGMSIVKSIVSQMDGQIAVESTLGKGSTFTVTLPLETVQSPKTAPDTPSSTPDLSNLNGKRILVAEDNEVNMEIATELLSMQGMEVTPAYDGAQAVERFVQSAPGYFDAILMDMQMPQMNGCDAARAIRAMDRPDARTVPILAVTANAFAEDIAATTDAGMDVHISKPIDFSILYQTLSEQIARRQS